MLYIDRQVLTVSAVKVQVSSNNISDWVSVTVTR